MPITIVKLTRTKEREKEGQILVQICFGYWEKCKMNKTRH